MSSYAENPPPKNSGEFEPPIWEEDDKTVSFISSEERVAEQKITSSLLTHQTIDSNEASNHSARLKGYQWWAFFVTFGCYFMAHFSRKCYSTVKQQLQESAGYSALLLSEIDMVFIGSLAIGNINIICAKLGDTFTPTTIISIGLFGSGVCLFLIYISLWFDFEGISEAFGNIFVLVVFSLFGLFQSTSEPISTGVVGNWFCDQGGINRSGLIFRLWTCHQYCGDITAQLTTAYVLLTGYAYWCGLLIPAVTSFLWGILTLRFIDDPIDVGSMTNDIRTRMRRQAAEVGGDEEVNDIGPVPITYADALCIPMVSQYTVVFGFLKLTNYVLLFWLPYFLGFQFDPVAANLIAVLYSVGMLFGGVIIGFMTNLFEGRRVTAIGVSMCGLIVFLSIFAREFEILGAKALLIMLAIMGTIVEVLNNIMASAVAADLVSHPRVRGNNTSLRTVIELINTCSSITAAFGLLAIEPLQSYYGWSSVWIFLKVCMATGTLLISPKMWIEIFSPVVEEEDETELTPIAHDD